MDSPGWKSPTNRHRRRSPWTAGPVERAHGCGAGQLADERRTQAAAGQAGATGRSSAATRGGGRVWARTRPDPPSSTPTACSTLGAGEAHMAVLHREAKGNAAPAGEHGSPSGMLWPGWGRSGWMASHGPARGVVRHEKKARGLSIGALLGAWHGAACAAHVGAAETGKSPVSAILAPTRWWGPRADRPKRSDQAQPGARRRVTTATPARLDFSAAEAPVKALQARCPHVAEPVWTIGPERKLLRRQATPDAMRKHLPVPSVWRGGVGWPRSRQWIR